MPRFGKRVSVGREMNVENHRRGRSLECLFQDKEDDLALFNEAGNKERDGFLLQSSDNFDDIFSIKLRYFSDYKLGIAIPARGKSSDLLNADKDKHDYDWLITPPETPLFRSLDDEPKPVKLVPRGRTRNQPVLISRSSMMEKDYKGSRGSASPHRLSPSQRSRSSALQSRSRPFLVNHWSPPPTMCHFSPVNRLSPPRSKLISSPRSTASTPRRTSTSSTSSSSPSRVRGSSPNKMSRANSASPKIRSWQTNILGISLDAPPNLRTSLEDRSGSHGSRASPTSRNGSRNVRQSASPTASRSVASSFVHDQDLFSSYSKGSVASSSDDVSSLQSIRLNCSEQSPRNMNAYPNNACMPLSRKPMKKLSTSAPKRSIDLVGQSDLQNMSSPLSSSVPSSTFRTSNLSAQNNSLISKNSSMATSRNASSDRATGRAHAVEESELSHVDMTTDGVDGHYPNMDNEVFVMEHIDALSEENEDINNSVGKNHASFIVVSPFDFVGSINKLDGTATRNSQMVDRKRDYSDLSNTLNNMVTCSKCSRILDRVEVVTPRDLQICLECRCLEAHSVLPDPPEPVMVSRHNTQNVHIMHGSDEVPNQYASASECIQDSCAHQTGETHHDPHNSYTDSSLNLSVELFEEGEPTSASQKTTENLDKGYMQLHHDEVNTSSILDFSESAGIPLSLIRSSSINGHIVQNKSSATITSNYNDFSSTKDGAFVSSSIDLGSARQTKFQNLWQSSGHKSNNKYHNYEMHVERKRSDSSVSSTSGHMSQVASDAPSCHEDSLEVIAGSINKEIGEEKFLDSCRRSLVSEVESTESNIESNIVLTNAPELSSHLRNEHSGEAPLHAVLTSEEPKSHENSENLMNNSHNRSNAEIPFVMVDDADRVDATEAHDSSALNLISEIEIENDEVVYYDSNSDIDSSDSKECTNELHLLDVGVVSSTIGEFKISNHAQQSVIEESPTLSGDTAQENGKSLTLEEATDVILFCRFIVHNLAYEAANIAIDNEALPVEVLQPVVTFEKKYISLTEHGYSSQEDQMKSVEMETTHSPYNTKTNEMSSPHIVNPPNDGAPFAKDNRSPSRSKSKCNCILM